MMNENENNVMNDDKVKDDGKVNREAEAIADDKVIDNIMQNNQHEQEININENKQEEEAIKTGDGEDDKKNKQHNQQQRQQEVKEEGNKQEEEEQYMNGDNNVQEKERKDDKADDDIEEEEEEAEHKQIKSIKVKLGNEVFDSNTYSNISVSHTDDVAVNATIEQSEDIDAVDGEVSSSQIAEAEATENNENNGNVIDNVENNPSMLIHSTKISTRGGKGRVKGGNWVKRSGSGHARGRGYSTDNKPAWRGSVKTFKPFIKKHYDENEMKWIVDVTGVFSKECMSAWYNARQVKPNDVEESYFKNLQSHLFGKARYDPFDPDEEEALLKVLRKTTKLPCFEEHGNSLIWPKDVQGYHEKSKIYQRNLELKRAIRDAKPLQDELVGENEIDNNNGGENNANDGDANDPLVEGEEEIEEEEEEEDDVDDDEDYEEGRRPAKAKYGSKAASARQKDKLAYSNTNGVRRSKRFLNESTEEAQDLSKKAKIIENTTEQVYSNEIAADPRYAGRENNVYEMANNSNVAQHVGYPPDYVAHHPHYPPGAYAYPPQQPPPPAAASPASPYGQMPYYPYMPYYNPYYPGYYPNSMQPMYPGYPQMYPHQAPGVPPMVNPPPPGAAMVPNPMHPHPHHVASYPQYPPAPIPPNSYPQHSAPAGWGHYPPHPPAQS